MRASERARESERERERERERAVRSRPRSLDLSEEADGAKKKEAKVQLAAEPAGVSSEDLQRADRILEGRLGKDVRKKKILVFRSE